MCNGNNINRSFLDIPPNDDISPNDTDLSPTENTQYLEILDLFCKCMKREITSDEFISRMRNYPQTVINYFTQNPVPISILNRHNIY